MTPVATLLKTFCGQHHVWWHRLAGHVNDNLGGLMMSLGEIYQDAIIDKYGFPDGWVANWPAAHGRQLGEVGSVEDPGFNKDGILADYELSASTAPAAGPKAGAWSYKTSKEIKVAFGVDASLPGWGFIGKAKAGLKIGFGSESGLVLYVGSSNYDSLADLDGLRKALLAAGRAGKVPLGRSIVVERLVADTGLVVGSEGGSGSVQATTNFDIQPGTAPTLASFAADADFSREDAALTREGYPQGFCVAFRVITLVPRGWLWWRRVEVAGIEPLSAETIEGVREAGTSENDFFAPFPDAF
jgi:hypothetical protein